MNHDARRPTYLRVVVTTACRLRCAYCHKEGDEGGGPPIDFQTMRKIMDAGLRNGIRKLKLLGGEPLLYADLPDLVRSVKEMDESVEISLITSGVFPSGRLDNVFAAGIDRVNLTIHGFTWDEFRVRPGRKGVHRRSDFELRNENLARAIEWGRPMKINYVYRGPCDDADLSQALSFAAREGLLVNVLDDLGDPEASWMTVYEAVRRIHGPEQRNRRDEDPDSLSTMHLSWSDGLSVEIKDQELGALAPWKACSDCDLRAKCREGIFAVRMTHDGKLRLCMDRPDLEIDVAGIVRDEGVEVAAASWGRWLRENMSVRHCNGEV